MLYWIHAFVAPVLVFGLSAAIVYGRTNNVPVVTVLLTMGILGVVLLAEFIRRRYGLETFLRPYTEAVN
jgi:hypothetical protein